jgi:parvulin-like peptidyl-prolyl isomerase
MSAIPQDKRLALVVFGAAVAIAIAAYGIFRGFGDPDVPSGAVAIVEDVPGEEGTITQEEFDRGLEQTAARAGLEEVPEPGSRDYDNLEQAAMGDLLDTVWIQGEAEDRGLTVPQSQVDDQLEQIKSQSFRSEREFQQFLERSGFIEEDIVERVKLQLLSDEIESSVSETAVPVSDDQVEEFYDAGESQFEQPETRDVRLILNEDRDRVLAAQQALEQDDSDSAWETVAKRYSSDPSSRNNGGLREGLTEGLLERELDRGVFAAPRGELQGPIQTPLGFYVFEVENVTPPRTPEFAELRGQIKGQLEQVAQQDAFARFVDDYGSKWQARTFCASEYLVDRCHNFEGTGHPPTAQPQCYEEDPEGGRPDCPASVLQTQPVLPGSVSVLNPAGTRLPQTPHPAGAVQPAPTGLPGAVPGAPPQVGAPPGTP